MKVSRRRWIQTMGLMGGVSALGMAPLVRALAQGKAESDTFIFIHASGGWDVTLWADPRNEKRGIIDPATTENVDIAGLLHWKDAPFSGSAKTFEPVILPNVSFPLGPTIGKLAGIADRLTLVNGIAMNTVSHPDGTVFSATGQPPSGGRVLASSIDAVLAAELDLNVLFPVLSVGFPSYLIGQADVRAAPLRVSTIFDLGKILGRSGVVESAEDRAQIAALLQEEAGDLTRSLPNPGEVERFAHQIQAVQKMTSGELKTLFDPYFLQRSYPAFQFNGRFGSAASHCAAFAVEALRKGLGRCISFNFQGFDTHGANYRAHPAALQELLNLVFALVTTLDNTPHPASAARKLSDSTHIFVMSEFCRTPQINQAAGRDHYPNNSALIISPRLRAPAVIGSTDSDQLLPVPISGFATGVRAITPADVLSTLAAAVGVDPKPHFRDGEVLRALLKS